MGRRSYGYYGVKFWETKGVLKLYRGNEILQEIIFTDKKRRQYNLEKLKRIAAPLIKKESTKEEPKEIYITIQLSI
jgi:hypothetical protein